MKKTYLKGLIEKTSNGGYRVLASTAAVDRQGDVIDQRGWSLDNFMKNPVMLWAHDYKSKPVAKVTGFENDPRGLIAQYEFALAAGNPEAPQIKWLVDNGFLNAVSVGFMPLEREGNTITKSELLEISFVPVPANQEALQLAYTKGLEGGIAKELLEKFFTTKHAFDDDSFIDEEEIADELDTDEPEEEDDLENTPTEDRSAKGAVGDEVQAEENMEMKWEKLDEVFEVMSAFVSVYLDEATPVEDFTKLLTEVIGLLQGVVADDGADDDESKTFGAAIAKIKKDKNARDLIVKLLKKEEAPVEEPVAEPAVEPEAPVETPAEEISTPTTDEVRSLLIVRGMLRGTETENRTALGAVNRLLNARRS